MPDCSVPSTRSRAWPSTGVTCRRSLLPRGPRQQSKAGFTRGPSGGSGGFVSFQFSPSSVSLHIQCRSGQSHWGDRGAPGTAQHVQRKASPSPHARALGHRVLAMLPLEGSIHFSPPQPLPSSPRFRPPIHPFTHTPSTHLLIHPSPTTCPSNHPFFHPSTHLSTYLIINPSTHPSTHPSSHSPIHPCSSTSHNPTTHSSIHPPTYPPI